jgi:hypothetical protein
VGVKQKRRRDDETMADFPVGGLLVISIRALALNVAYYFGTIKDFNQEALSESERPPNADVLYVRNRPTSPRDGCGSSQSAQSGVLLRPDFGIDRHNSWQGLQREQLSEGNACALLPGLT